MCWWNAEARAVYRPRRMRPNSGACGWAGLRKLPLILDQPVKRVGKIAKRCSWKHDGIPAAADILCDLQKPTPLVLFEIEEENFPFNRDLLRCQGVHPCSLSWI